MYTLKKEPEDFIVEEINENISFTESGEYAIFILKKRNITTIKAIQYIQDTFHLNRQDIGFAGYKDKKALTTQYISLPRHKIKSTLDNEHIDGRTFEITLKKIGFSDKNIFPGFLDKNKFIISIYDVQTTGIELPKYAINYYGVQRFSRKNIEIGKAILNKDFKTALEIHLEQEDQKTRDYEKIYDYYIKHPTDYIGSLKRINEHILKLYVQAYQSYLWNSCAEIMSKNNQEQKKIPILGYDSNLFKYSKEIRNIYQEILKEEGITKRNFLVRSIPELSLTGGERRVLMDIEEQKIIEQKDTYLKISFILPKGSYATEYIRQFVYNTHSTKELYLLEK